MKIKLIGLLLVLVLAVPLAAAPPKGKTAQSSSRGIDNTEFIDVNRILMFVTNHGNVGRDLAGVFGNDYGTFFPYGGDTSRIRSGEEINSPLYAAGLWIGAIDSASGDTLVAISEYDSEYTPGFMTGGTFSPDLPGFRIYKLYRDSLSANPNNDFNNWPVSQGAPIDNLGDPDMIGDQMLWSVFNDADPSHKTNDAGTTDPMGIEVKQTAFAYDRLGSLGNIVFMRYRIYNKGDKVLNNCYFSIWSDPDLGGSGDDLVGCDTLLGVGYIYNATNSDQYYNAAPPCLGIDFFQGPLVYTGNTDDTARMWDTTWVGYQNLGMKSFNKYINGTDPVDYVETYSFMTGLAKIGGAMVPYVYDGDTLLFQHSGDPRIPEGGDGRGDVDIAANDRRMMQSTGPITFRPGDSTEILAAIIVGQGTNRLTSITTMLGLDDFAQALYEKGFNPPDPPAKPRVLYRGLDGEITLTWDQTSEIDPGDFQFEGYSLWQGESPAGPWELIKTWDIVNDRDTALIDTQFNSVLGVNEIYVYRMLENKGLNYHYHTNQDLITGEKMVNLKPYYFRVTAFSHSVDFEGEPVPHLDRFLESQTVITVSPEKAVVDTVLHQVAGDTIAVTHVSGGSDGIVAPIVMDPFLLTGDTYRVVFKEDTTIDSYQIISDSLIITVLTDTCAVEWDTAGDSIIVTYCADTTIDEYDTTDVTDTLINTFWELTNVTQDTVILDTVFNQSGDGDYQVIDGFLLKVLGPEFGVKAIQEVAGADGVISPPDNVMWSYNSTGDWYIGSDLGSDFTRLNWRGLIGTYDWEMRFTATGQEYYDYNDDSKFGTNAPFEFWNIGIGTPDDPSDDIHINFEIIDDDSTGAWSYGDRIYAFEQPYVFPAPDPADYVWPDDFRIGRIIVNAASGTTTTAPAEGTIIRFTTAKINTPADTFTFTSPSPTPRAQNEDALSEIRAVPNPFYLFSDYDPNPASKVIKFTNLPAKCSISIYNLGGDFVRRVEKDNASTSTASWDALTTEGLPVASGIYIYVVEAPGFGQKIGKLAVFTESEILQIY